MISSCKFEADFLVIINVAAISLQSERQLLETKRQKLLQESQGHIEAMQNGLSSSPLSTEPARVYRCSLLATYHRIAQCIRYASVYRQIWYRSELGLTNVLILFPFNI